ncbi:caspase family protein [Paenibacillus sp. A3M_27_13]|uniref:caspase family protein n=1 Tax=Paenibacillus sp. A3M_27_13 TaxID=2962029 RepID=UPI0020B7D35E|nr:caspase family protein [Paenibacillus sp. A3M_27_13]MCP3747560.1 caspase family protein [Paenibacillus sp. A3M_27_13]
MKVVLIGANIYQNFDDLNSVENDINLMKEVFDNNFDATVEVLTNEKVKSGNVKSMLKHFFSNCDYNDILVLYWAGHGAVYEGKGYLITYDSTDSEANNKIAMQDLNELIEDSPAKSILVVVDCCKSGFLTRNINAVNNVMNKEFDIKGKGRVIITATNHEDAYSLSDESNGVFTSILLQHLQEFIDDQQRDEIDVTELYSYVVRDMNDGIYKQVPCMKASIEGRFILKLKEKNYKKTNSNMKVTMLPRGANRQLEKLDKIFKNSDYLDKQHFIKEIQIYLGSELIAGKVKEISKHLFLDEALNLEIEWFEWALNFRISQMKSNYVIKLPREEAELAYKLTNEKKCIVYLKLSQLHEEILPDTIWLRINDKNIKLPGGYLRRCYRELPMKEDIEYKLMELIENQRSIITLDNSNKVAKWDTNNLTIISSFKIREKVGDIFSFKYSSTKETIFVGSIFKDRLLFNLYNSKGENIYSEKFDVNVYYFYPNSGDYIIYYNKTEIYFVSLQEKIEKNFKIRGKFLMRRQVPLFYELDEGFLLYNFNTLYIFNNKFELLKEEKIYNDGFKRIINKNLFLSRKVEHYSIVNIEKKGDWYPKKTVSRLDILQSHVLKHHIIEVREMNNEMGYFVEVTDLTTGKSEFYNMKEKPMEFTISDDNTFMAALTEYGAIKLWV